MNQPIDPDLPETAERLSRGAFRSHAQSLEDASLFKALRDVRAGSYLDIGSYHPLRDSVSAGFYEKGWRGLSVDPLPGLAALYDQERPDETFIAAAISNQNNSATLARVEGTGLSAIDGDSADRIAVKTLPLSDLLSQINGPVHWMKIDVEGHEHAVIDSWNDHPARPWILCLECEGETPPTWHDALTQRDYDFVRSDGLNRFYLHRDHIERREALASPPSILDRILITEWSGLSEIPNRLISLRAERDSMQAMMKRQDQALDDYRFALKSANRAQEELHQSIKDHRHAIDAGNEAQDHLHRHVAKLESDLKRATEKLDKASRPASNTLKTKFNRLRQELETVQQSHLAAVDLLRADAFRTETDLSIARADRRIMQDERAQHQARIHDLEAQLSGLREREAHLVDEVARHADGLTQMRASTAWRITAPIRAAGSFAHSGRRRAQSVAGRVRSSGWRHTVKIWLLDQAVIHWRRDYKLMRPLRLFILNRPSLGRRLAMRPDHWDESWNEVDPFDPDPTRTQAIIAKDRAADPNPARYKGPIPSEHPQTLSPGRRPPPTLFSPRSDQRAMLRLLKQRPRRRRPGS